MLRTRVAALPDLEAIVDIYNQAIAAQATAYIEPRTVENRREWFARHPPSRNPILVAELDGEIVGWSSLSEYRPGRQAVRHTAEISYFVHSDHHRKGVGSELLRASIELCPAVGIKTLLAILLEDNVASIGLLRRFEFEHWGTMPRVADFHGREVGHLYFGRRVC